MGLQDFTTYTEIDEWGNDITIVDAHTIDVVDMESRNANTYVYKDKGAGFFGNFEHKIDAKITQGVSASFLTIWNVNNGPGMHSFLIGTNAIGVYFYHQAAAPNEQLRLYDYKLANVDVSPLAGAYPWQRYLTISRIGNSAICKIYTDAARTVLSDTMTVTCIVTTLRYIETCGAQLDTSSGGPIWATIENLDLQYNDPPNAPINPVPNDGASGLVPPDVTLSIDVSDPNLDNMDVSFYDASDDSLIGTAIGVPSGDTCALVWEGLECGQTYSWYVIADDGEETTQSDTFTFTMQACQFQFKHPLRGRVEDRFKYKNKTDHEGKYRSKSNKNYKYKYNRQR
jgi:hypothetical protein